jgi:hypothetical protein
MSGNHPKETILYSQEIFEKHSNIEFHDNVSSESQVVPLRTNMKLIVAFCNFVDMPKIPEPPAEGLWTYWCKKNVVLLVFHVLYMVVVKHYPYSAQVRP